MFVEQSIAEKQRESKLKKRSRENSWQPITPNDIRLYIAVLIYRGLIWKPTIHMYYTKNILFSTPRVPAIMPQQKFILSENYLHFVDNITLTPELGRRAKVAPIFDNISNVKRKGKVEQVPEIIETYNSKMRGGGEGRSKRPNAY